MSGTFALSALALLGASASARVLPRSLTTSGSSFASQTFDYVVVGGGTAGLAVAAR
jgi:hypothetical protein